MQYCGYCGAALPMNARFCGICGNTIGDVARGAAEPGGSSQVNPPASSTPRTPPLFSSPAHSIIINAQTGQEDVDVTVRHTWADHELLAAQNTPPGEGRQTDENQALRPDAVLPFSPWQGQSPAGQVPVVQGTPQVGGVPAVPGTPPAANMPPAQGTAPPASPQAPSWEVPQGHPAYHPFPRQQPAPQPRPTGLIREPHHLPHTAVVRAPRPRFPRVHTTGAGAVSKVAAGTAAKWIMLAVAAVVVVATSGALFVLAKAPALTLSGNSTVSVGGTLHIQGSGFLPGGSVSLTLDNSQPLSVGPGGASSARQGATEGAASASADLLLAAQQVNYATANAAVSVGPTGSFDADIVAQASWSPGAHIIHAVESLGSRSASIQFTLLKPVLSVTPQALDFGTVQVGSQVVRSILVGDTGSSRLNWSASIVKDSKWLKLQNSSGVINPGNPQEPLDVTADASRLKQGNYADTIKIHSNAGDTQVAVTLNVVPQSAKKQAKLDVNPTSLDVGKLAANQQWLQSISIGNLGNLPLKWQASTDSGSTNWLTLSTTSGVVQPGTLPQTLQVLVNTTGLAAGSYSATISISSNGGNATIRVTLTVTAQPQGGSPTPSPTLPPLILSASPTSFNVSGDPNCTYSATAGWACSVTLSAFGNGQPSLNWSASSSGVSGVSFSPPNGTLTPGQTAQVTIAIPNTICPASATFTFSGPANQVLAPWSCAALTLTASKTSFNANTDCTFSNGWACSLDLGTGQSDQGELNWSAASSGINGITISPASGTLAAGGSATVHITVPNATCPANASLSFAEKGGNVVTVSWSCGNATLVVNPSSISVPTSSCPYTAGQGWVCTVSLSLAHPGDPSVSWTASGGVTGTTFTPASGVVTGGQPVSVTITVPDTVCPTQASITFSGQGANTLTVPWSCAPPALSAAATPSNCPQNPDGSYTCTDTVSEPANAQGNLVWSASASSNLPGVTFSPQTGTLSPNQSTKVTITVPANDCTNGSFIYSEQGSNVTATVGWTCTPPQLALSVNPTSFSSSNCSNNGKTWVCAATLTSNGTLSWYATSNDPSAISFSPSSGTVSPGSPATVTIYIPYSCPSSATLDFVGQGANTVQATWSC